MTPEEIDNYLLEPRDAVLSVVVGSGRAIGTPIWFTWVPGSDRGDGVARFQSPTTSAKTRALRATGRASLCVHDQPLPVARYVTLEGPVTEVEFDMEADIATSARHYLGTDADRFIAKIQGALAAGREWASFELRPTLIDHKVQSLS